MLTHSAWIENLSYLSPHRLLYRVQTIQFTFCTFIQVVYMAQVTERPAAIEEPTDLLPATGLSNSSKATSRADRHQGAPEPTNGAAADAPAAPQEHSQQQDAKGRKLLVILHGKRLDDDTVRNAILVGCRTEEVACNCRIWLHCSSLLCLSPGLHSQSNALG